MQRKGLKTVKYGLLFAGSLLLLLVIVACPPPGDLGKVDKVDCVFLARWVKFTPEAEEIVLADIGQIVLWQGGHARSEGDQLTFQFNGWTLTLTKGSKQALLNGNPVEMSAPAERVSGRLMVPLDFIRKQFGLDIPTDASCFSLDLTKLLTERISNEAIIDEIFLVPNSQDRVLLFKEIHRTALIAQEIGGSLIALQDILDAIGVEGTARSANLNEKLMMYQVLHDILREESLAAFLPQLAWNALSFNVISADGYYVLATGQPILIGVEDEAAYQAHLKCIEEGRSSCPEEIEDRDRQIAANIDAILKPPKVNILAVPIGAGHINHDPSNPGSGELPRLLREKGVSYYILTPKDLDRCWEGIRNRQESVRRECGAIKDYTQCLLHNQCPELPNHLVISDLLEWLQGDIKTKLTVTKPEFKKQLLNLVGEALAFRYLGQGLRMNEMRTRFAALQSRIKSLLPSEDQGLVSSLKPPGHDPAVKVRSKFKSFFVLEGSTGRRALVALPDAYFSNRGVIRLGVDVTWDPSLNAQIEDLLTLPQNGPARAELVAAFQTPEAVSVWEWNRADGSKVYGHLRNNVIRELSESQYVQKLAQRIPGSALKELSSSVRTALLQDLYAVRKLDAWLHYDAYPQLLMLKVGSAYLLAQQERNIRKVVEMEPELVDLIMSIKQRMRDHPVPPPEYGTNYARYVVEQLLSEEERELIRDQLVLPLVRHMNPLIEGDHISLDLQGELFALRDLPADLVLRTLIPYFLRGNRLVYVAESSTAWEIEAKLQTSIDHTKLKFFVSLPTDAIGTPAEADWKAKIEELKKLIEEQGLGVEVEDLTDVDPKTAKQALQKALSEEESLVFGFAHQLVTGSLQVGREGTFAHEDLEQVESRFKPERFVAFVSCRGDALAWPDRVVKKLGVLSFSFFEYFDAQELLSLLNAVVEELGKDPSARPQVIPFFLDIMEKLRLEKGGPVVQVPFDLRDVNEG